MSPAEELMVSIELRLDGFDLFGVDLEPNEPWSYPLDEPSLLLHTLRGDIDDMRRAETDAEADEIWAQVRSFILAFHVGAMN